MKTEVKATRRNSKSSGAHLERDDVKNRQDTVIEDFCNCHEAAKARLALFIAQGLFPRLRETLGIQVDLERFGVKLALLTRRHRATKS